MEVSSSSKSSSNDSDLVRKRIKSALFGLFVSDALAMPTHWYYGGSRQIISEFGGPIKKFERSQRTFPGSIMNKSNTGGAGRGSDAGTIIGNVINHGKKKYWTSGLGYHYHHTLQAGENTLEAQLVRVLMKSIVANRGSFNAEHFCKSYVDFMTTPGSHNDTYASTAHRQFFENYTNGRQPMRCASNDGHNTDAIDALILPAIVALATLNKSRSEAIAISQQCSEVTRRSNDVQTYVAMIVPLIRSVAVNQVNLSTALEVLVSKSKRFRGMDIVRPRNLVTA